MAAAGRQPLLLRHAPWLGLRLVAGLVATGLAVFLSRMAVNRLWTFVPESFPPDRFPWGTPVTPDSAWHFEVVMGSIVLGLLIVPSSQQFLLPWLRERLASRG